MLTGSVFEAGRGRGRGAARRLLALRPVEGPDRGGRRPPLPRGRASASPSSSSPTRSARSRSRASAPTSSALGRKGRPPRSTRRLYVRDNIHVSLLATAYAKFAGETAAGKGARKLNPSGYVEAQGAFAERFAAAMRPRLGLACGLELGDADRILRAADAGQHRIRPRATSGTGTSRRRGTRRRRGIGIDRRQRLLTRVGASDDGIRILRGWSSRPFWMPISSSCSRLGTTAIYSSHRITK